MRCQGAQRSCSTRGDDSGEGPTALSLDGYPNGLWWDEASGTLFVADDQNNRVLTWADGDGFGVLGDLPEAAASSPGLRQPVLVEDRVIVLRFGDGTAGDVVWIGLDGGTGTVPDLDVERRRIGLALAPDGTLYDGWFTKSGDSQVGGVSELSLDGIETSCVDDLEKPVGLLADEDALYIADQKNGLVLRKGMPGSGSGGGGDGNGGAPTEFASVPEPDLMCWGRNGRIFVYNKSGTGYEVDSAGAESALYESEAESSGSQSSRRGIAYDATNGRLFLSHHDETGEADTGLVVPVDP